MRKRKRSPSGIALRKLNSKRRKKLRKKLYEEYDGKCYMCNVECTPFDYVIEGRIPSNYGTIDHIVSTSNGGTNEMSNLALACNECNGRKSVGE